MTTSLVNRANNLYGFSPLVQLIRKSKVTAINGHRRVYLFTNTYSSLSRDENLRKSIRNHVDVSLTLAKHVFSAAKGDSNIVFSPLSINVILGLIAAGSKGPARDELLAFLKSKSTGDLNTFYSRIVSVILADGSDIGGPRLSVANGLWIDQTLSLNPSFKHVVDSVYKATSESVNFQNEAKEVANQVNLWVEKETRGLIKKILSANQVTDTTRLILANALYFKGAWTEKQFDTSMTKDQEFHLLNGSSVQVPFMSSSDKRQCVKAFNGFKVLQLPYEEGDDIRRDFSMYIFLPDAMDGLPSLLDKVCSESGFLERHLPNDVVRVGKFRIPKFKISFGFEASTVLQELGVVSPFTEMVDSPEGLYLHVSNIFHKAFIEVNEEGTEAAAVTFSLCGNSRMAVRDKVDFVADHPFMFVIREDLSGVILFLGTLLNPRHSP